MIRFERDLPYPIESVWSAITDPGQRAMWFGRTTIEDGQIDMIPTGPAFPVEAKRMTGRILVWDPPHTFEHEWRQAVAGETGSVAELSVVRYELAESGSGTRLTFTHRGLSAPTAERFTPGTNAYLDRLVAHLAGTPLPNWTERYRELSGTEPIL